MFTTLKSISAKGRRVVGVNERRRQLRWPLSHWQIKSPMAMMPPTIVVATASAPPVMMSASAAMTPSMATTMPMAAPDLNYSTIRHAKRIWRCDRHSRDRQCWN